MSVRAPAIRIGIGRIGIGRIGIGRGELLAMARTLTAVVASLLSAVLLRSVVGLTAQAPVLAVTLALTLRRIPLDVADCLAALTDDLADGKTDGTAARFGEAIARLDELTPTLAAHQRLHGRLARDRLPHAMDAVRALRELEQLPPDGHERKRLRRDAGRVRRAMVGRDDPAPDELVPPLGQVHRVLQTTARPPARVAG